MGLGLRESEGPWLCTTPALRPCRAGGRRRIHCSASGRCPPGLRLWPLLSQPCLPVNPGGRGRELRPDCGALTLPLPSRLWAVCLLRRVSWPLTVLPP